MNDEKKMIITASGTIKDITRRLDVLRAIFPKGATLAEVAKATRYARLNTITRQQIEEAEAQNAADPFTVYKWAKRKK